MPRALSIALDDAMLSVRRTPAFRVFVYDVRSAANDTIGDIVRELSLETITGPREFTDDVVAGALTERAGDYLAGGIVPTQISLRVLDPIGALDPLAGVDGRWLRQGNVIRVIEGDATVDQDDWVTTFTGELVGQPGYDRNRTTNQAEITVTAVDRSARFLKHNIVSQVFPASSAYSFMAQEIARNDMGLDNDELEFSAWGTATPNVTTLDTTQFVDEPPMIVLARLMFTSLFMPKWTGLGKLSDTDGVITKSPARIYSDTASPIRSIVRPPIELSAPNVVTVLGLASEMTKVTQPRQILATLQATTGYFTPDQTFKVFFSDDHTQLAENTSLFVVRGVNEGLISLGSKESYAPITITDGLSAVAEIGGEVKIFSGYAPYLLTLIQVLMLAASFIPDTVVAFGAGVTVPVGRVVEMTLTIAALFIMATIGAGQYEIIGDPYEYVFNEIRATAEVDGLSQADRNEVTVENHLVQTQTQGDGVAFSILQRLQAKQNARNISMIPDLRLEPDDIFETEDARRYMITAITRAYGRGGAGSADTTLEAFEVTPSVLGVLP